MKKYALLLTLTALTICIVTFISHNTDTQNPNIRTVPEIIFDEPEEISEISYIARDLDDYVAIFVPNSSSPYIVTDIYVKTLPLFDQELLKEGIIIDKDYTLARFIEDFDGH